jgi:hypothetical protein
MKILMCKRVGGAFGYITDGMVNALRDGGHHVRRYQENDPKSIWKSFDPDIYIGCSGHRQYIPPKHERRCKIAIHVNPHGPINVKPNINERPDAINWVKNQQPDVVFGYGHDKDKKIWSSWEQLGIPWTPMGTAGDATVFIPDWDNHSSRELDFAYIGGRWDYKAKSIDKYLFPLFWKSKLNYEVHGWGNWPNKVCEGRATDEQVPIIYRRAKVAPCIGEPHTQDYGIDIPERVFKACLSGCVAVHDPAPGIKQILPNLRVVQNPDAYYEQVMAISKMSDEKRLTLAKAQYGDVIGAHTYHHRMARLFDDLDFLEEASDMLLAVEKYEVDKICGG